MKRIIPVILLLLLAHLTPLPPSDGGCPVHGPSCAHGSSCPTVQRQIAEKAAASCQTAHGGHETEAKKYRCAITSCHADTSPGLAGLDAPFLVDLARPSFEVLFVARVRQPLKDFDGASVKDISEPPEGLLIS